MERNIIKKVIRRFVAASIALGCLPGYAQNFDPPGAHTFYLHGSTKKVDVTDPYGGHYTGYIAGYPELRYGRDFLTGGKPRIVYTNSKIGYIPLYVGPSKYSCSTTSCSIAIQSNVNDCTTVQMTYGLTAKADLPVLNTLTFSVQKANSVQVCAGANTTITDTYGPGDIPSGMKRVPMTAVGYLDADTYHESSRVYWSPAIKSKNNDQNSELWTKVYNVCKKLGWTPPTQHWSSARDVIKQTGFCYLGSSNTLKGYMYGPQPVDRIMISPLLATNAIRNVGTFYYGNAW